MTVCIAARSEGFILVATDRMLTVGDIHFEPPTQKVMFLTSSIAIMFAGDAAFFMEIYNEVHREVQDRIAAAPDNWLLVSDVAEMYLRYRDIIRRNRAERAILTPLGLTLNGFLNMQRTMDPGLVNALSRDLVAYPVPGVSVIVAGIEPRGQDGSIPRMLTIHDATLVADNPVGFTTIGGGHRHAASQFMLGGHAWNAGLPESLLLTYTAKKAAEIAPGVGVETDFYMIGAGLGRSLRVADQYIKKLDKLYRNVKKQEIMARKRANSELTRYLESIVTQSTQPQNDPNTGGGTDG